MDCRGSAFRNPPRGSQPVGNQAERKLRDGAGDSVTAGDAVTAELRCCRGSLFPGSWSSQALGRSEAADEQKLERLGRCGADPSKA